MKKFRICGNGFTKVSNNTNGYSLHFTHQNDREYYTNLGYIEV